MDTLQTGVALKQTPSHLPHHRLVYRRHFTLSTGAKRTTQGAAIFHVATNAVCGARDVPASHCLQLPESVRDSDKIPALSCERASVLMAVNRLQMYNFVARHGGTRL